MDDITSKVAKMIVWGHRNMRIVAEIILCQAYENIQVKQIMEEVLYQSHDLPNYKDIEIKKTFGKVKYASARKMYDLLLKGDETPIHNYTFRVDSGKLKLVFDFIRETLQVKPGVIRDVNMFGEQFKSLPVYERGGISVKDLFGTYKECCVDNETNKQHVGYYTFCSIVKLMTKRGESKAGLSTYYISLRYGTSIFDKMMDRVSELTSGDMEISNATSKKLKDEWFDIHLFIISEYSSKHLKISDKDPCH